MHYSRARRVLSGLGAALLAFEPLSSFAQQPLPPVRSDSLPQNGQVTAGAASIATSGTADAPALSITQTSQRAAISWSSFNLGSNATINFSQPDASSVTLNRVQSSDASQIFGRISANGQVYLINPYGVYFGPTASVDVGGLVATTMTMSDEEFMAGSTTFRRNGAKGFVTNDGTLTAGVGGYIALLAPEVQNAGVIVAKAGTVALAAGDAVALNVDPNNSLTSILASPSTVGALIENHKIIKAPDGQVVVSAQAYNELTSGVIKNSGTISAKGISSKGGMITLGASDRIEQTGKLNVSSKGGSGGKVSLSAKTITQGGSINASSKASGGKGGTVEITGDSIRLASTSAINASGPAGGGTVLVGGDYQGSNGVYQAKKVTMDQGAIIDASATQNGNGGKVVLWSDIQNADSLTSFSGTILASGGFQGGDGGQVETSGHDLNVTETARVDASAPHGTAGGWLLDPFDVTISSNATTGVIANNATATGANVNVTALQNSANAAAVTITTGSGGTQTGNITVANDISLNSANLLTLDAHGSVILNANITQAGSGGLTLYSRVSGGFRVAATSR
mgnify:CR=1 FL=1